MHRCKVVLICIGPVYWCVHIYIASIMYLLNPWDITMYVTYRTHVKEGVVEGKTADTQTSLQIMMGKDGIKILCCNM